MANVTISMDEQTLGWVRVEAAKAGMSVSRWIGEQLTRARELGADASIEAFLAEPGWDLDLENQTFDRDAIYDERIRGLERRDLRSGPGQRRQAAAGASVAEAPRPFAGPGDERTGGE